MESLLWSAFSAIIGFLTGSVVSEFVRREFVRHRQLSALLVDCVGTSRAISEVIADIENECLSVLDSTEREIAAVRKLPSGYVLSKPTATSALIEYIGRQFGMRVVQYLDKWDRVLEFERRYAIQYFKLLESAAAENPNRLLIDEYWTQCSDLLKSLLSVSRELNALSIEIFGMIWDKLGNDDLDSTIAALTDGGWKRRSDLVGALAAAKAATSVTPAAPSAARQLKPPRGST